MARLGYARNRGSTRVRTAACRIGRVRDVSWAAVALARTACCGGVTVCWRRHVLAVADADDAR